MNWIKELAPLLGTVLGGPIGGALAAFAPTAASMVAEKLGLSESTVETVTSALNSGKLSADQIAAIKLAEMDFQKFLEANKIDLERIAAADRDSARKMQIATNSYIPGTLAVFVTLGFFLILLALMYGRVEKSDALMIMLGSLGTAWASIIGFYFGSSHGSQSKDVLLATTGTKK